MSLLTNLISYWKMDEASGNALDAHGTNALTDQNGVTSGTGIINGARDFEADSFRYFSHVDNSDLSTGDIDFTFAAWVNFESLTGGDSNALRVIVSKDNFTSLAAANIEYDFYLYTDNKIYFDVSNGLTIGEVGTTGTFTTATWYYLVAWHDSVGNTLNLQTNNGTVDTAAWTGGGSDTAFDFQIGRGGGNSRYMDGLIDEVGFWKRTLTTQERTDLYNGGAGLPYSSFGGGGGSGGVWLWRG